MFNNFIRFQINLHHSRHITGKLSPLAAKRTSGLKETKKQDGSCKSVRRTERSDIPLKDAKTTSNFCQRNHWEYPKATDMHWRKLVALFGKKHAVHLNQHKQNFFTTFKKDKCSIQFEIHEHGKSI